MESGTTSTTAHARYRLEPESIRYSVFAFFDSQSAWFIASFPRGGNKTVGFKVQLPIVSRLSLANVFEGTRLLSHC